MLLPHVTKGLKRLTLFKTYNGQALYLLRSIVPGGVLPQLRSLTVDLRTSCHAEAITREGSRWVETKEGVVTEMDEDYADRWFDHNYLMTLSKAAPHLQELHLSGTSSDHIVSRLELILSTFLMIK